VQGARVLERPSAAFVASPQKNMNFSLQDRSGVAFILNVTDPAAAHDMLEKLPLGQAHLMSFELIPLAPLNPLRQLQGMSTGLP
jgi:hypothetical protein